MTQLPVAPVPGTGSDLAVSRAVAAVGLLAIALIHLLDLPSKLEETPYLGVAYLGLIATSMLLATALVRRDDRSLWLATGGLAVAVLAGFVVNRTVGLPGAMDDRGNWLEPLGLASLFVEVTVATLAFVSARRLANGAHRARH
jgi:hypothetical protein